MTEHRLVRDFTAILFPFRYEAEQLKTEAFNALVTRKNGKQAQLWTPDALQPYHLKENVAAMLGVGQTKGTIGQVWRLNDALRREMELPDGRTPVFFHYRGCEKEAELYLEGVRLALFATGIGFLELSVNCRTESAEALQDVNYFLCEVKSDDNRLRYVRRLGKDESVTVELTVLDTVKKLLAPLGAVEDFDTRPGLRYVDNKPLVFSYLLLEHFGEDLGKLLFGLRTNFKASYQVPAEQYALQTAQGVCHPFENVYWGASLNAAVCCASLTDNDKTNEFFNNTFPANLRQTYLLLYLLRQHQRYAVQNFQRRFVTAGDGLERTEAKNVRDAYQRVSALLDEGVTFKLGCMFRDPASVEHINHIDQFLVETLHTRENLRDFEDGVHQLELVASEIRKKIDEREKRRSKMNSLRRETMVYIITALWGCITFLESSWDVVEKLTGIQLTFRSWWALIPAAITVFPLCKLVSELLSRRKELKKLEKEFGRKKKE